MVDISLHWKSWQNFDYELGKNKIIAQKINYSEVEVQA